MRVPFLLLFRFMRTSTLHVAIIMDGNGRWAKARGLPRAAGHVAGVKALRRAVDAAARSRMVGVLTCYAFSSDNWKRPQDEVGHLMRLLLRAMEEYEAECLRNGIRVSAIGRRDRLPRELVTRIEALERTTAHGNRVHLRLAIDYSARWLLEEAVHLSEGSLAERIATLQHELEPAPDVDLVIRTAGEQRLSDFLLYESAYAELLFLDKPWPEFQAADLQRALQWFDHRERRFGGLPAA